MNRAKLEPSNTIQVYRITSDMIKQFLTAKVSWACPQATVDCVPVYTEVKKSSPRRSFAYINIALSDTVIEKSSDNAWLSGLIGNSENVRFLPKVWTYIIDKYKYDPEYLKQKKKNPDFMDKVNDNLGMSDLDYETLIKMATPHTTESKATNRRFIVFAARADKIIENMLEDPATDRLNGSVKVVETIPITKDNVEFVCHLSDGEKSITYNSEIRDILGK